MRATSGPWRSALSGISDIDGEAPTLDAASMLLAELLVAASLLGLIFAATTPVLHHVLRAFGDGAARIETQQATRVALERLAHDIRGAGYGGGSDAFSAVAVAETSRIVLQSDLDGNGVIAGSGETVSWRLAPGGVLRRDAGGGAQPIVNGVRAFTLTYLEASGAVAATPSAVRAVRIELVTESTRHASPGARGIASTLATTIFLRNR
jgi:Tfp pilus assembly protein PilW